MSLTSVATRGYRNSTSLVAVRGYGGAAAPAAPEPTAVILRRRKTKIWEEPRLEEVERALETKAAYETLVARRDSTQDALKKLAKVESARADYVALRRELVQIRKDLGTTKVRLAIEQQAADVAMKRYAAQQEEDEVRDIIMFVVQLWD